MSTATATKTYTIQSRDSFESDDDSSWEDWQSDTDAAELLKEFVNAVSGEEIDDVNRYWRVVESD